MDIACPQCAAAYEIDDATVGASGRKVRCAACGTVWRVERWTSDAMPAAASEPPLAEAATPSEPIAADPAEIKPAEVEPADTDSADADSADAGLVDAALADGDSGAIDPQPVQPLTATPDEAGAKPAPRRARWVKGGGKPAAPRPLWRRIVGWRSAAIAACMVLVIGGLHQREGVVRLLPQTASLYAAIGMPVNLRGIAIRNVASRVVADGEDPVLVVDGDLVNVTNRKVDVPRLYFTVLGKDGQPLYAWSAQADRPSLLPGETLNFRRRLAAPPQDGKDVRVRFLTRSDITAGIK